MMQALCIVNQTIGKASKTRGFLRRNLVGVLQQKSFSLLHVRKTNPEICFPGMGSPPNYHQTRLIAGTETSSSLCLQLLQGQPSRMCYKATGPTSIGITGAQTMETESGAVLQDSTPDDLH
ncbi:Hypothetical predicted protein [Mytilus galloprovincialis]|uniref:Uncharacterized protein n=1 Tax=Mytilus galloprovincialis TaxID=29158 RepID=A0A8B6F4Q5_MYTGA|nr:Hypothetical predicted protein [Mytilus galloprovincialis]